MRVNDDQTRGKKVRRPRNPETNLPFPTSNLLSVNGWG